ncbi:MAG: UV DNA damage repair endonuclease UvsE [Myxococcota bacterium]
MLRLGLCCGFVDEPIRFRTATARYVAGLPLAAARAYLLEVARHNAFSLEQAVQWCAQHDVGAFRIPSKLIPLATHPEHHQLLRVLDDDTTFQASVQRVRRLAPRIRLSFHPDPFVVPGSASNGTSESSLRELEHHARMAHWVGAEQITIHGGGAQPDKKQALLRLVRALDRLSRAARERVVLENDDRVFTVEDLLPACHQHGIPLVYDVHHHRCNPDGLSEEEATVQAAATWGGREPWAHVSSPEAGWSEADPRPHADFIQPRDFPVHWLTTRLTVDVEAKARERAVLRLQRWIRRHDAAATVPAAPLH